MTRTMLRVVLFLFLLGLYGTLTAGAHKDYEVGAGNSEQRLEGASLQHSLESTICYETALVCTIKAQTTAYIEPVSVEIPSKLDFGDADPRIETIRQFFVKVQSPGTKYAELFIQVADANKIDWRLLPTFAFLESGGGRVHVRNNIFGWDSGRVRFKTIEDGIRHVGRALTLGPYKGKTPTQVIRVYNVYGNYHKKADKIMNLINEMHNSLTNLKNPIP